MPTIAISVPTGSHHRALLQPLRDFFVREPDWNILIISPGAPWAEELFPATVYPRPKFTFAETKTSEWQAPATQAMLRALYRERRPTLVLTTTTGRDPVDRPILAVANKLGIRTCTFVESWDNVWKMARKRAEQVIPDHLIVWNEIMKSHLLREFPELSADRVSVTGAPRLDYFQHQDNLPSREHLFDDLGLDPKKRLLHLATVELYDMSYVAEHIREAKRRGHLPADLQLYASMHPGSGKPDMHTPWAEKYGYTLRYSFGRRDAAPHPDFLFNPTMEEMLRLVALWRETDVMVNFSSTAALESMLADRPTIAVLYGKATLADVINPMQWLAMSEQHKNGVGGPSTPRAARRSGSFSSLPLVEWWNWRRSAVVRDFREHYRDLVRGGGVRVVRHRRDLIPTIQDSLADPERDHDGRQRSCEIIMTTLKGDASEKTFAVIKKLVSG